MSAKKQVILDQIFFIAVDLTMTFKNLPLKPFLKGNVVRIRPQFQDLGDNEFTWVVLADEEKGRVDISAIDSILKIKPIHTVQVDWIEHVSDKSE